MTKVVVHPCATANAYPVATFQNYHQQVNEKQSSVAELSISEAIDLYCETLHLRKPRNAKYVVREKLPPLEILKKLFPNKNITDLKFTDAYEYAKTIQQIPKYMGRKRYKRLTLKRIIQVTEEEGDRLLATRTVNKYLEVCSSFFNFLVQSGHVNQNFFQGKALRLYDERTESEQKLPFTSQELKKILERGKYFGGGGINGFYKPVYFWGVLIALHSGLRVNEICQMWIDDVQCMKGIWCFNIKPTYGDNYDDKDSKHLKNKASQRIVPIHDTLIDLGFLNYIKEVKASGNKKLFPEITKLKKGTHGYVLSDWFNDKVSRYYDIDDRKKTFHSLRHNFTNQFKQKLSNEAVVARLSGHATSGITYSRYGSEYSPKVLKTEGIDKIKYRINWSLLKKSCTNPWHRDE